MDPSKEPANRPGYRIFVSYSHRDRDHVGALVSYLKEEGFDVLWTENLSPGQGFTEQIQRFISLSHLCLVFLTPSSHARGWVQQEIGYARALKVPVLPLTVGVLPKGLIEFDQAIRMDSRVPRPQGHASSWRDAFTGRVRRCLAYDAYMRACTDSRTLQAAALADAIRSQITIAAADSADMGVPSWRYVQDNSDRVRVLVDYARAIRRLGRYGMVRQKSGLTSFQTPAVSPNDPYFDVRYAAVIREHAYRQSICDERTALGEHALQCGARLVINPHGDYSHYGPRSKQIRTEKLIAFLAHACHPDVSAVVIREANPRESLTLVGDWFSAASVDIQLGRGFRQTVFCTHAPTVSRQVEAFDNQFDRLLLDRGIAPTGADAPERSRQVAIKELSAILDAEPWPSGAHLASPA